MKGRLYLTDEATVRGLIKARKDLLAAARGMKADDMRAAIQEIYAAAKILETPQTAEDMQGLYDLDNEGIAHIPVVGILTPSIDPCAAFFQEASTEYGFIQAALKRASEDFSVWGIELEIDSPGGYVDGLGETAQMIRASEKPIAARVHNLAASAAYWLASQADSILVSSPADQVGSIGVVVDEYDDDEWYAQKGITHRVYTSTDAPDKRPDTKTPEGRSKIIKMLDDMHGVFASEVAEGRETTVENVNANYGRGGLLIASDAIKVGMVDGFSDVMAWGPNCPKKKKKKTSASAELSGVAGNTAAQADGIQGTGRGTMTLEELKRDHPELHAAVLAAGREAGVAEERKRVAKLQAWADNNPVCADIVAKALVSGETAEDMTPQFMAAIQKGREAGGEAPENPPQVNTAAAASGSGEGQAEVSDEQIKAALAKLPA